MLVTPTVNLTQATAMSPFHVILFGRFKLFNQFLSGNSRVRDLDPATHDTYYI